MTSTYSKTKVNEKTLTKKEKAQQVREMRETLEGLGSDVVTIVHNLHKQGCRFGLLGGRKGCIMEQFFKLNPTFKDHSIGSILDSIVKPRNRKLIWQVVSINDIVKP